MPGGVASRPRMKLEPGVSFLREVVTEGREDDALRLGAALAFYALFSRAPRRLLRRAPRLRPPALPAARRGGGPGRRDPAPRGAPARAERAAPAAQLPGLLPHDHRPLRPHLRGAARRAHGLAGRVARRGGDRAPLHAREDPDRPLSRADGPRVGLRRRRVARRAPAVGLLLGTDPARRRRVHRGVLASLWLAARAIGGGARAASAARTRRACRSGRRASTR